MTTTHRSLTCRWCDGPNVHKGSAAARVFDLLDSEGPECWLTIPDIHDRLGPSRSFTAVSRAVYRLAQGGKLRRSTVMRRGQIRTVFAVALNRPATVDHEWPPRSFEAGFLCSCGQFVANPHRLPLTHVASAHRQDHGRAS